MARPRLGDGEPERLHVKISTEELTAIDDWRFANRIPSRSEAVRRLVQLGVRASANINGIADAVHIATEKVFELDDAWAVILDEHQDNKTNLKSYAYELALAFSNTYSDIVLRCQDAHNMVANLALELSPIRSELPLPEAMQLADKEKLKLQSAGVIGLRKALK
ncbi:hypothetical protein LP421_07920 [Rhizobium sp. RCAM05350]|nr:hypothetical protein LP421_07920 [Rhizobium sp. RCAM05350]